jgi:hypothetical protein
MLRWRLSDEPVAEQEKDVDGNVDLEARKQVAAPSAPPVTTASLRLNIFPTLHCQVKCTIFLGYTSNIISRWGGREERARVELRAVPLAISLTSSAQRSQGNRPFSVPAQAGRLHRQHGWRHRGGLHQVSGTDQDRCVLVRVQLRARTPDEQQVISLWTANR